MSNSIPRVTQNSESPFPPLPIPILTSTSQRLMPDLPDSQLRPRNLREGCYLLRYTPTLSSTVLNFIHYDGTLRVERDDTNVIASGDLYIHRWFPIAGLPLPTEPNSTLGIPIFPRNNYRYYLRVTQILEGTTSDNKLSLGFDRYLFDHTTNTWTNEGSFTATMTWVPAPAEYLSSSNYLMGEVKDMSGAISGTLSMGLVSPYFRRATIEIDRVADSEPPLNNSVGIGWQEIFQQVGWDINVIESNSAVVDPSGESWSEAELHAAMLSHRDSADLDAEWRYHILCVRKIDTTPRGIMYDNGGTDSNNVPREGAGIASHWIMPNEDPWGLVKGMRFGTATAPYFRTAVHELGHAMGLYHNTVDMGIMNTTDVIAENAMLPVQFPNNIRWSHAPDDQKRLRHMPDMYIRPGGTPFGTNYTIVPISPDDLVEEISGLKLQVFPLLETIPIGAPVRINFKLTNTLEQAMPVPASLSLKSGAVSGRVIDPSGKIRTFRPIVRCLDTETLQLLQPGEIINHAITLLRGAEGALFPIAGPYRVVVEVQWDIKGFAVKTTGATNIMVTPSVDNDHARAALKILSTPDALLTLVIGGDHLSEGVEAIQTGINNLVLRPHYAIIEAKRVGQRFGKRQADLETATQLLDDTTVLNEPELKHAVNLVKLASQQDVSQPKERIKMLQKWVKAFNVSNEIVESVKSIVKHEG